MYEAAEDEHQLVGRGVPIYSLANHFAWKNTGQIVSDGWGNPTTRDGMDASVVVEGGQSTMY